MKYLFVLFIIVSGCTVDELLAELGRTNDESANSSESFLPMSVGNLWKVNDENYTEIQDTLRIEGELFYKFYSLIGGDGVQTQYLRIDKQDRLIQRFPDNPASPVLHADFSAEVGDTFSTLGDGSINDYLVEVSAKSDSSMTFDYQNKQQDYATYQKTFIKGLGYQEDYAVVELY